MIDATRLGRELADAIAASADAGPDLYVIGVVVTTSPLRVRPDGTPSASTTIAASSAAGAGNLGVGQQVLMVFVPGPRAWVVIGRLTA